MSEEMEKRVRGRSVGGARVGNTMKYTIDTEENRLYLKELAQELLSFAVRFPLLFFTMAWLGSVL